MWCWILLLCAVVVFLLIAWIDIRERAKQRKNRRMNENGETKMIGRYNEPLVATVMAFVNVFSGGVRGKHAIKKFVDKSKFGDQGRVYQSNFFGFHTLVTWNADYTKAILFTKEDAMSKVEKTTSVTENFFGDSILVSRGDTWKAHKTVLSPAFDWKHVRNIFPAFRTISQRLGEKWCKDEPTDLLDSLRLATLDAIGSGGFGFEFNSIDQGAESQEHKVYDNLMKELQNPVHLIGPLDRFLGTDKKFTNYLNAFDSFIQQLISTKREMYKNSGQDWCPVDILDFLISAEHNESLTDRQIAHDMNTFFIAGHETTAGALHSAIHLLARHPEAQERLRNEILDICGDNVPSFDDIKQMPYLDNCLKETLRLFPPAPLITRQVLKDQKVDDLVLRKGTMILMSIYDIQRDVEYWGEKANDFIPDRFLEKDRKKSVYLPFSLGPRQCIGNNFALLEMKTFLAILIQQFSFSPKPDCKEEFCDFMKAILTTNPNCLLDISKL